ncbi:MAG TPA: ribonuclease H-like domain-containing protein [bacterium]|nr:ribonuclease H-like domain-containing protein [bacterium]
MADARDFRAKLREIARARARGESPPRPQPPADNVVALEQLWPASRAEGFWRCRPEWPKGYPPPEIPPTFIGTFAAFDVESLGRTPKPLFLVGFGRMSADGVAFEQYLAGHPDEEGAVLQATARALADADVLLSYNGRTFDLPIIRDRLRWWRLPYEEPRRHVDLLWLVRKYYKERCDMPACGLAEAERYVLGVQRPADIYSSQVPELYERYVKIGDARPLEPVLRHNLYDVAATLLLSLKMEEDVRGELEDEADNWADTEDLF